MVELNRGDRFGEVLHAAHDVAVARPYLGKGFALNKRDEVVSHNQW